MEQQWSFVKDPLTMAMWVVLAISLTIIFVSKYQQQNTSRDVSNNSSKNKLVYPMTDHPPITKRNRRMVPVSPQQQNANT
jgi:hypothetical protein